MKTIVLTNNTETTQETVYVSIANKWIRIYEERALREEEHWEEFPLSFLEEKADEALCCHLRKMTDEESIKTLVKLKSFNPKVTQKLKSFKLGD